MYMTIYNFTEYIAHGYRAVNHNVKGGIYDWNRLSEVDDKHATAQPLLLGGWARRAKDERMGDIHHAN